MAMQVAKEKAKEKKSYFVLVYDIHSDLFRVKKSGKNSASYTQIRVATRIIIYFCQKRKETVTNVTEKWEQVIL